VTSISAHRADASLFALAGVRHHEVDLAAYFRYGGRSRKIAQGLGGPKKGDRMLPRRAVRRRQSCADPERASHIIEQGAARCPRSGEQARVSEQ